MLNSFEIAQELQRLGYQLTVNNTHANGYQHPSSAELVFVKMSKTGKPVLAQPFLIHPNNRYTPAWSSITGITPGKPTLEYRNTNMRGFPKVVGASSHRAIALDVSSVTSLQELLKTLGEQNLEIEALLKAEDVECVSIDLNLSEAGVGKTERDALIRARIGQGAYREALIAYWGCCAVTGCTDLKMLRASHVKPWRHASHAERLDPYNGLLLTPNLDLAFDQGLITFDDQGLIQLSSDLDPDSAAALHLHTSLSLRQIKPPHRAYLAWHREHLFRK